MSYLVIVEGPTEYVFFNLLIDKNLLIISRKDLLQREIFTRSRVKHSMVSMISQLPPMDSVEILRIGDTMVENFRIPKGIENRIESIKKYCTKPEFEILLIIEKDLLDEYERVKSRQKPKDFAKTHIEHNKKKYDNNTKWLKAYFETWEDDKFIEILTKYKKKKKHKKGELFIADLLKK